MASLRNASLVLALGITASVPLLTTCQPPEAPGPVAPIPAEDLRGLAYSVTVDPSLASLDVGLCFDGTPPARLVPGMQAAGPHTRDVQTAAGEPLPRLDRGYDLRGLEPGACVRYRVDVAGLEDDEATSRQVGHTGRSLLTRPGAWLWRPEPRPASAQATLQVSLPEGMQASLAWPTLTEHPRGTEGTTYVLDATAFDWLSYAVMGELTIDRFVHASAEIELVTLDAPVACPPEGLRAWVVDAVDTVALLYGRFPRERLQIVVIPVEGGGGGTVYFGMAARGGGAGVQIFLDDRARAEALPGGWTTVHELLHHGMPFVEEPWMAEGFVTYYTELMRTRARHRSEGDGWQALLDGFGRGRRDGTELTLAQTSETMHETHAYQRVYWGGAAIALLLDVELRLESGGTRSLDDAMKELRRCCGDAEHQWKAQALLEHLDGWYGRPAFTQAAAAVLAGHELPRIEDALARVGVGVGADGKVVLDDAHPDAATRRAIMAPPR